MRRVLIVSPSFPPKNTADLHRVRTSLPYYREFGWEPTVLCLTPESTRGLDDPMLAQSIPPDIRVERVRAWDIEKTRKFGFSGNDHRGLIPINHAARSILRQDRHDVVFFSTTSAFTFVLGPVLKRKFGCRIVYDIQDPWFHEQPAYTRANVPGAWWRYWMNRKLAYHLERFSMKAADHLISVSPGYVDMLSARYPWLERSMFTVLPFGAAQGDFDFVRENAIRQPIFPENDGMIRWVYAGRGGPDMDPVLGALFRQLAALRNKNPKLLENVRLNFVGTNYAPAERTRKVIEPLAQQYGVADLVEEHSVRIPLHQTLALYLRSDAILLIGSAASDYTASKLFQCALAQRPMLALFHAQSLVSQIARHFSNVHLATFDSQPSEPQFEASVLQGLERLRANAVPAAATAAELAPWSARELTRQQCATFDRLVGPPSS